MRSTTGRAALILVVSVTLAAMTVGVPAAGADTGGTMSVASPTARRGGAVAVSLTGCQDDFQAAEVRLVSGVGPSRRSVAVASDGGSGTVALPVPDWTPDGIAWVEATCLEPDLSGASDGAEVARFTFPAATVWVSGLLRPSRAPTVSATMVGGGAEVRVGGTGCDGWVKVAVAQGTSKVADSSRFHFGPAFVPADAAGRWSADLALRYAVSTFSDPMAPGPIVLFASCGGTSYEPVALRIPDGRDRPRIQVAEWDARAVYASQCDPGNALVIQVEALTPSGPVSFVVTRPGPGFGEVFTWIDLPADTQSVTYGAACEGSAGPSFTYQPTTVVLS